jgi:hypothetical protein
MKGLVFSGLVYGTKPPFQQVFEATYPIMIRIPLRENGVEDWLTVERESTCIVVAFFIYMCIYIVQSGVELPLYCPSFLTIHFSSFL